MRSLRVLGIWGILPLCIWVFSPASHAQNACTAIFSLPASEILPHSIRVSTYNLQHFKTEGRPEDRERIHALKNVIDGLKSDILVLTEVVDRVSLAHLAGELVTKYRRFIIEGNDQGGHIAILLKQELPVEAVYDTNKQLMWRDPTNNVYEPVFVRDAPALILRRKNQDKPFLIVVGVHSKSQRHRTGDPRSEIQRTAEFHAYMQVREAYKQQFGEDVPVIIAGDFNTDMVRSPESRVLKTELRSAFDVAQEATPPKDRITHTFHPKEQPTERHQIDDILVPPSLAQSILKAIVNRYKDVFGNILPFADSFEKRSSQPSDHLPISVDISTESL